MPSDVGLPTWPEPDWSAPNVQIDRLSREIGQLFELSLQASDMSTYWGDQAMHAREILDWWD